MNLKKTLLAIAPIVTFVLASPLRAQSGCTDSPEDPTLILALVAGAGTLAASVWRHRHKRD